MRRPGVVAWLPSDSPHRSIRERAVHRHVASEVELMSAIGCSSSACAIVAPCVLTTSSLDRIMSVLAAAGIPLLMTGELSLGSVNVCLAAQRRRPTNALLGDTIDRSWLDFLLR